MSLKRGLVTLTANPSIDRTIALPGALERGAVIRIEHMTSQAGGKGVNISRAAATAGVPTLAVLPARPDDQFVSELLAAGIATHPCPRSGEIRVNLTLTEPDGTTTKLNSPGAELGADDLAELADALARSAAGAAWTVLAGSLPPGAPADFYAQLLPRLTGSTRVAVDTSEAPLVALVEALDGAAPALMKPNAEELASLTGGDPDRLEADPALAAAAAQILIERGVGAVLATLGAHGAVLVDRDGAWVATPPAIDVVSTVGAGDCSLFGYILGDLRGLPAPERLALAVAYGSAAAALPGTTIPGPGEVRPDAVAVRALEVLPT
ncbi:1-phosphofructokinase family hexose kinase [Nocardioides sp.]|uniref:1-phosphofructokinase family hexose kinase n=1 Tax=Nocardioides sp. TaxID=35761 RepID=UPI003569FC5A